MVLFDRIKNIFVRLFCFKQNGSYRIFYFCGIKFSKKISTNKVFLKSNETLVPCKKIKNLKININGNNNTIIIDGTTVFKHSSILIENDNCSINIGRNNLLGVKIRMSRGDGQKIEIGDNNTLHSVSMVCDETSSIKIGNNNLISAMINIWASDGHSIIDRQNKDILNPCGHIEIGNHNWISEDVRFTKNAKIKDDVVVGAGSLLTKSFNESNIVLAGNPAKIIKNNIEWTEINPYHLGILRGEKDVK